MEYKPHKYQLTAFDWIVDHERCCLFLDMGLGKTVVTLTAVQRLIDWCEVSKVLVVAPKKVAEATWATEAAKWDHLRGLSVSVATGTAEQRHAALSADADVYVIGRDNLAWLMDAFNQRPPFDMLVLDELTSFKSHRSLRFRAVRRMGPRLRRVVGLTGTPAPNGYADLWAEMYCIDRGERLGQFVTGYYDKYFESVMRNHITIKRTLKKGMDKVITAKLSDICLTMQAKDYLELPERFTHDVRVPLDDEATNAYDRMARDRYARFVSSVKAEGIDEGTDIEDLKDTVVAMNAAALVSKLAQMANGAVYDDGRNVHEIHRAKFQALAEIVESARAQGSGVLVFYQYIHDCDRLMEYFSDTFRIRKYEGPGDLKAWNSGQIDILLAHPASTAYGLNMQEGGCYAVWFGTGWNLELYEQANARLHRQGQTRPVHIYRLLAEGTVDIRMAKSLEAKHGAQQSLLDALKYLKEHYESKDDGEGQELPETD